MERPALRLVHDAAVTPRPQRGTLRYADPRDPAVPREEALAAARGCLIAVALGAALWTLLVVAAVLAVT
jgi:hypothetical protein